MTGVLIAFAIVLLVPLYVGTWRTSLLGLSIQGALLASIALRHATGGSLDGAVVLVDLVVLRTVAAPLAIYVALRAQNAGPRNDVIAPNLFSWAAALVLVVVAFRAADIVVPAEGSEHMLVAIACAAFLLGLFVLSSAKTTLGQIIGVLRIENAIALFELGASHHEPLGIHAGTTALLLASIAYYRWYLIRLAREESVPAGAEIGAL